MNSKIRLTVVALLPEGVNGERIHDYIDPVINGEEQTVTKTIFRTATMENQTQRLYVKISKMVPERDIKDGWHLRITERFDNAGCADVAWKITRVDPMDLDAENTTVSFPVELFQKSLENDDDEVVLPEIPLKDFGSDAFWEWFVIDAR